MIDSDRLARLLNWVVLVLVVLNGVVIFIFEKGRRPEIVRHETTVVTNHVIVVTNYLSSVSSVVSGSSSSSVVVDRGGAEVPRQITIDYDFFIFAGRRYITWLGQHLTLDSPTSYGRIVEIYPERVLLDSGVWLVRSGRSSDRFLRDLVPAGSVHDPGVRLSASAGDFLSSRNGEVANDGI